MKFKKTLSLILAVLFIIGTVGTVSFAEAEKPFFVVLGDSIAYGTGMKNNLDACYGKIVAETNGYDYVNHAWPGHTTGALIDRLGEEEVISDVAKADIISISIGGNNFLLSNLISLMFDAMVIENYEKYDEIVEGFYSDLITIVDTINGCNEDAVILLQTIYNPQSGHLRAPYQQAADRLNGAIYRFEKENPGEIVVVDVASALSDNMENYASDDIHPSTQGNYKIAVEILKKLKELGYGENTEPVITVQGQDIETSFIFKIYLQFYGSLFHVLSVIFNLFR